MPAEFVTSGIDATLDTNLTSNLDRVTRDFKEHGDPDTFVGDITEVITQYGAPGTLAFKLIGNANKIKKEVKNLKQYLDKTIRKNKRIKKQSICCRCNIYSYKSRSSALALSIADAVASDSDREITFVDKVDEEGLEGRDLAVARLANKIKYGQRALVGGAIPILGKGSISWC